MRVAIIASSRDPAGKTIHVALREKPALGDAKVPDISIQLIDQELLAADNLEKAIPANLFIFASKHRSSSNTKSFAVHSIGNWDIANAGGKDKELCQSPALLQREIFLSLLKRQREGYEVTMEATHHGPFTSVPSVFVEVGSTEEEWNDKENARIIAESILEGLDDYLKAKEAKASGPDSMDKIANDKNSMGENSNEKNNNNETPMVNERMENKKYGNNKTMKENENNRNGRAKIAVGIGGPHYCNSFNKLVSRKNYAIGHICPKHHLEKLDEEMLRQAIEKTVGKVDAIVLDWKGLGQEKARLLDVLKIFDIPVERTDQLLKE